MQRPPRIAGFVIRFFDILLSWHDNAEDRRQLCSFDARMLKDIGISRYDAEAEAMQTELPADRLIGLSRGNC